MSDCTGLGDLVDQIKQATNDIKVADTNFGQRLYSAEKCISELYRKTSRPGGFGGGSDDASFERKSATEMCHIKHQIDVPRFETTEYVPSSAQVDAALAAKRGLSALIRHGDMHKLDAFERKSLSAFSFGTNQFMMPPQMASQALSCLVYPSDLSGLTNRVTISAGSIKFLIDNARMACGAWACESSCFANNPVPDLQEGLGELEIKAETIRMVVCATSYLLEDASFDVQAWLVDKISTGMSATVNQAILVGDGLGKPLGLLHAKSGVPICETSVSTPPGTFTWQDLIMLKYEIPMQWQTGASYLMNQRTFALLLTMSDAGGRPMWSSLPGEEPGFRLAGSLVIIASQVPDVAPGATPVAYGNFKKAYTIVERRQATLEIDNYSAGWCRLFKFSARIGGSVTCSNALRLLRVR